ncbi:MAG: DUF3168 domain-containing protein [Rhizobiaceae bacterium]|nr:DUF3168 domain-containing protein [Rhizobiaceae bacterium]
MTAPAAEVQKAIHAALSGDAGVLALLGGARVYDHAPPNVPFPYITFGRTSIYDWSTGTESGTEQLLTLHVWSKGKGKKEAHALVDAVGERLNDADLALDGHELVNLRLEFSEVRFDEDQSVHHGLLRFRAVTEPSA